MRSGSKIIIILAAATLLIAVCSLAGYIITADKNNADNNLSNNLSITHSVNTSLNEGSIGSITYYPKIEAEDVVDATVSLIKYGYNQTTGRNGRIGLLEIEGNPKKCDGVDSMGHFYRFNRIPYGYYYLIFEKDGYSYETPCVVDSGNPHVSMSVRFNNNTISIPEGKTLSNRTIYGYVRDVYFDPVEGATVTLWRSHQINTPPYWVNDEVISLSENPQKTMKDPEGFFWFVVDGSGNYTVIAEKNGAVSSIHMSITDRTQAKDNYLSLILKSSKE